MTTSASRCPRCGGALKPGAQWCGLCYADLRPAPAPPPPPPEPAPAPVVPTPPAAAPLFAPVPPRDALDGEPFDDAVTTAEIAPPARKGWPCVECGALNPFDFEACAACGLPFGAGLRTPPPRLPGDRRTRIVVASLVAVALVAIIAILSMATGSPPPEDQPTPEAPIILEQ